MVKKDFEKEIIELVKDDFSYTIKERGKEYYDEENVLSCRKSNNTYYAKVEGSETEPYTVTIEYDKKEGFAYDCDCPCNYPCKHEYAVIMSIHNKEYEEKELKEIIPEKKYKVKDILKDIPAEELKKIVLSNPNAVIRRDTFEKYFYKYVPKQGYKYYYNKLYNKLMIEDFPYDIRDYMRKAEEYISVKEYEESYNILKSIIEAYNDTEKLKNITEYFPNIGMYLRIIYRKINKETKQEINKWISILKDKNYYNNVYLEDVIETIK